MSLSYVQSNTLYQAGSGNIIGATSIVLTSLTDIYGNVLTMASFGTMGYITLEPDTTNEEAAIFTGITANSNGTYTLTGVSTILAQTPYTASSGLVRQHSGGTKVVITDNVAFWATFGQTQNPNTWVGLQTFSVVPTIPVTPVASTDAASKGYVDSVAVAGAPNASTTVKGIVQEATQAQMDAGTASGSTGADLYPTPALIRSKLLSDYVADTGAADVYVITPSPAIAAYATGQRFSFKLSATNATTTPTLNVNGKGAKTIVKLGGSAMAAGDLLIGQVVEVEYDGTYMQLMSPVATVPITSATNIQTFLTTNTWTMPTGAKKVLVQAWGGGGSGAAAYTYGLGDIYGAAGGGGGEYVAQWFDASALTSSVTVTVGTGGAAVTKSAHSTGPGNAGNNSTFGAYLTAHGGGAGTSADKTSSLNSAGGNGGATLTLAGFYGTSGSGATGFYSAAGADDPYTGSPDVAGNSLYGGGGGGSQASTTAGTSVFGGAGGAGVSTTGSPTATTGSVPGGGGGGALTNTSGGTATSGAGGAGKIIVTTFF
jgi:hypothetical protein